ncbi:hypothetical protein JCM10908_006623 [Rhodotorula pacifica]|uniref:uncharacterized protein n=1 Tax=Rhodotorula pacifica TaxID=1495444 RepID=UPI00317C78ED
MHLKSFLAPLAALLLSSSAAVVSARPTSSPTPDVEANIKFPDSNPFGRVTNGDSNNLLHVRVQNHADHAITVLRVRGQFREASGKERPLRETTTMRLGMPVSPKSKSPLIPYKFHSENKIGDVGLRVWVDYNDANNNAHSVLGYDSTVTVGEPKSSWFDLELLFLYALLGAFFAGGAYFVYTSYFEPTVTTSKSKKKRTTSSSSTPSRPHAVTAKSSSIVDGTTGEKKKVDESWVPEHHLRTRGAGGKKAAGGGYVSAGATSGEESEGRKSGRAARK